MARAIPNYALYGDQARPAWLSTFDFEWIPQRSRPYNWDIQPHTHDAFVQVLMLTSGGGTVHLDHARIEMASPCLIVVPAQTVHGFRFTPDTNGPVITAAQRPLESLAALVMPELVQTVRTPRVMPLAPEGLEQLMPLFLAVEREHRQGDTGHVAAALALLTALAVQIARLQREVPAAPGHPLTRKAEQIEAFRRAVDERFREHLPVTAYAAALGVTAGQLTRLAEVAKLPNVHIRWVPFSHGFYPGQETDYHLATYAADPALHLVYVERYDEQAVLHEPKIVKRYLDLWEAQEKVALGSDQAASFLAFVGGPLPS